VPYKLALVLLHCSITANASTAAAAAAAYTLSELIPTAALRCHCTLLLLLLVPV
jgi:hypothetical protein